MWIVVRTAKKHTKSVAAEIGGYVPMMKRWTKPARKKQPVISEVPIFGGWVFVQWSEELYNRLDKIAGVYGVMKYGRTGIMMLTDEDIDQVRDIEALPVDLGDENSIAWQPGDKCWVGGVLDTAGIVEEVLASGYIRVNIGATYPIQVNHCLISRKMV